MKINDIVLFEDFGNLNSIEPKFRGLFANRYSYHSRKDAHKPGDIANKSVGQNSPIEATPIKSASQAAKMLLSGEEEFRNVKGMVLMVDGNQVLAIGKDDKSRLSSEQDYRVILDVDFYLDVEKDQERKDKLAKILYISMSAKNSTTTDNLNNSKTRTVLSAVYNAAKSAGHEITALVIKTDPVRQSKQKERAAARFNAIAVDQISPKFRDDAKRSLRARLDKFKASKAKDYATPQEFLKAALTDGFLDKISIDGFAYELNHNSQLRIQDIANPSKSHWGNANKIEYTIDSFNSDKYRALKKELWNSHEDKTPEQQARLEALKAKFPPRSIKITFAMQGGTIVPAEVEASTEKDFY